MKSNNEGYLVDGVTVGDTEALVVVVADTVTVAVLVADSVADSVGDAESVVVAVTLAEVVYVPLAVDESVVDAVPVAETVVEAVAVSVYVVEVVAVAEAVLDALAVADTVEVLVVVPDTVAVADAVDVKEIVRDGDTDSSSATCTRTGISARFENVPEIKWIPSGKSYTHANVQAHTRRLREAYLAGEGGDGGLCSSQLCSERRRVVQRYRERRTEAGHVCGQQTGISLTLRQLSSLWRGQDDCK